MTLKGVMTLILRYFTEFGSLRGALRKSGCKIDFASKSCILLYWQRYCTALEQWASAKLRRDIFTRQGGRAVRYWAVELSSSFPHLMYENSYEIYSSRPTTYHPLDPTTSDNRRAADRPRWSPG